MSRATYFLTFFAIACVPLQSHASSCAELAGRVGTLSASISAHVKSYEAPRLHQSLLRLDMSVSSAATHIISLASWMDVPSGGFGGSLDETMLRDSMSRLETRMHESCQRVLRDVESLQQNVDNALLTSQLKAQTQTQNLAVMARMGQSQFDGGIRGVGIADSMISNMGANLMIKALEGQSRAQARHHQGLGNTLDSMSTPYLHAFDDEVLRLADKARSLKSTHQQNSMQADRQSRKKMGDGHIGGAKDETDGKSYSRDNFDCLRCPSSFFSVGGQLATQAKDRCERVYLSVLASEAADANDAQAFLQRATRPLAKRLHSWGNARVQEEAGGDPTLVGQQGFKIFDVDIDNSVIVAFKGTETFSDIFTSAQISTTSSIPGGVHSGFYKRSHMFPIEIITRLLSAGKRVIVTGYSSGGAVASVLTLRVLYEEILAHEYQQNIYCVTFGSPAVATAGLQHTENFLHIVHRSDLVPRLHFITKDLYEKLSAALQNVGFQEMFTHLAKKAYDLLPWFGKLAAEMGQGAYALWKHQQDSNDRWFIYTPFGDYVFLRNGKTILSDQADAQEFMEMMMPNLGSDMLAASLGDHSLQRYAEQLEVLRMRSAGANEEL